MKGIINFVVSMYMNVKVIEEI